MYRLGWGALCLLLFGCPVQPEVGPFVTCIDGDPRCGASCSEARACEAGLYCTGGGQCAKQCLAMENSGCSDGAQCSPSGKCMEVSSQPMGGMGGVLGAGGRGPRAGVGGAGAAGMGPARGGMGADMPPACLQTELRTKRVQPTVILIVDQSASMMEDFGGGTRWDVLRDSLLAEPSGLIAALQGQVAFGLALYSADSSPDDDDDGPPDVVGQCPAVTSIAPSLNNHGAIAALYRAQTWLDDTPTGDSINAILDSLDLDQHPSTESHPIVFVVATDGAPDRCENLDPSDPSEQALARMEAVAAVTRAFQNNIRTYMISVGDEIASSHMIEMANAGIGRAPTDAPAEYWAPTNDLSLRDALTSIVGAEVSCEIALEGEVPGDDHCLGTVELNGMPLRCDDDNGWQLSDASHIRLLGNACRQLKNDSEAALEVSFPCEVEVVIPQ